MADQGIKKAIVKKEDLPSFDGKNQRYSVRYRVVSDDKNRFSHWSPYHSLSLTIPINQDLEHSISVNNRILNMVWASPVDEIVVSYDIYFNFNNTSWNYVGTTLVNQFSSLIPASVSTMLVSLHRSTYPKTYDPLNTYFISDPVTV